MWHDLKKCQHFDNILKSLYINSVHNFLHLCIINSMTKEKNNNNHAFKLV